MRGSAEPAVRRALAAHVLATGAVLLVVAVLVTLGTLRVARQDADALAARTSTQVARAVVGSLAALRFDGADRSDADTALAPFLRSGTVHRVKVWRVEGDVVRVVHSDEPRVVGDERPFDPAMGARLDAGDVVVLAVPADVEHRYEAEHRLGLREVFVGFAGADGAPLRLELYVPVDDRRLVGDVAWHVLPLVLGGLLVLAGAGVPFTLRVARRAAAAADERARLLRYALSASDAERRRVAQVLHDGVVQDLAAARLLLEQAARGPVPGGAEAVGTAHGLVAGGVRDLRSLLVDLHPTGEGGPDLAAALAAVVARVDDELGPGPTARVEVEGAPAVTDAAAGLLLRGARELLRNAWRHARATGVVVTLRQDAGAVLLRVDDDGLGVAAPPRAGAGHVGLSLLRAAAQEAGGALDVTQRAGGGTRAALRVPADLAGTPAGEGTASRPPRVGRWWGAPPASRRRPRAR